MDTDIPGILIQFESNKKKEFYEVLGESTDVDLVVCEDYLIRPKDLTKNWGHEWNNGPALRMIGAIDFWAQNYSIEMVLQQPSIKPVGYGYIGAKYVKGKAKMHHIDAIAHGAYFLVKNKLATPKDFKHGNQAQAGSQ